MDDFLSCTWLSSIAGDLPCRPTSQWSARVYLMVACNSMVRMHIGCHGVDHQRWDKWSFKNQEQEILQSKNFFKKNKLYSDIFSVCYPWGSYNHNSKKVLKKLSVSFGLTSDTGNFYINSNHNRYLLPRYDANEFKNI